LRGKRRQRRPRLCWDDCVKRPRMCRKCGRIRTKDKKNGRLLEEEIVEEKGEEKEEEN